MTLRRGEPWGGPGPLAAGAPVVDSDAALIACLGDIIAAGDPAEAGLVGGDLHTTLGAPSHSADELRAGRGVRYPVDVGSVEITSVDGSTRNLLFAAHLVAVQGPRMRPLFSRRTLVVMNTTHRGGDDLGPRAHPGDGLLDVTDGSLGTWDRLRAKGRMATGTHLPHPALCTSRARQTAASFDPPATVAVDGVVLDSPVTRLEIECLPDAMTVVA